MSTFTVEAPFGLLFAEVTPKGLRRLEFLGGLREPPLRRAVAQPREAGNEPLSPQEQMIAAALETQLREYFEGTRREFEIPLDIAEGSEFRRRVWDVVASIPYGETLSYADVAAEAGNPSAYRAAGSACGANPIVILIPCHRVVGSDRRLQGVGGGLDTKAWLLQHEGREIGAQRELLLSRVEGLAAV
jgi:methylated-DNA-[protein]-cysteine S-methyltransferase